MVSLANSVIFKVHFIIYNYYRQQGILIHTMSRCMLQTNTRQLCFPWFNELKIQPICDVLVPTTPFLYVHDLLAVTLPCLHDDLMQPASKCTCQSRLTCYKFMYCYHIVYITWKLDEVALPRLTWHQWACLHIFTYFNPGTKWTFSKFSGNPYNNTVISATCRSEINIESIKQKL